MHDHNADPIASPQPHEDQQPHQQAPHGDCWVKVGDLASGLDIHVRTGGSLTELHLAGEVDLASAPALRERLDAATAHAHSKVVIDLGALTFIDAIGLGLLCRARNRALERGGQVILHRPTRRTLHILRLADLDQAFPLTGAPGDRE
jgi:anti-anti-sigma factor